METELRLESTAVEAALLGWRRNAGDVLMLAAAAVHLPALIIIMLGHGTPMGPWVRVIAIPAYLVLLAAALFRRIEYRTRVWSFFSIVYLWVGVTSLAAARGTYAQLGLVILPIMALVLWGARAARISILASATIFVSAALLRGVPAVARALAIHPSQHVSPGLVGFQAVMLAMWMVGSMVLLDQFHRFLLKALAAQYRAKSALEQEIIQRTAAQQKVVSEVRERQRLEHEITVVSDGERRRLGQELHDGVCQQLTAALLRCEALQRRFERGGTLASADIAPLSSLLGEAVDEAHSIALGLCPLEPDPEALAPALRALVNRVQQMTAAQCEFITTGDVRVPEPESAQHLYRIAQEGLSNAVRHARANRILVGLHGNSGELVLQVEDDGAGLPTELPAGGMGLRTMAYRAQILKGELTVRPAPNGGTCVTCRVPYSTSVPAVGHKLGDQRWIPAT